MDDGSVMVFSSPENFSGNLPSLVTFFYLRVSLLCAKYFFYIRIAPLVLQPKREGPLKTFYFSSMDIGKWREDDHLSDGGAARQIKKSIGREASTGSQMIPQKWACCMCMCC